MLRFTRRTSKLVLSLSLGTYLSYRWLFARLLLLTVVVAGGRLGQVDGHRLLVAIAVKGNLRRVTNLVLVQGRPQFTRVVNLSVAKFSDHVILLDSRVISRGTISDLRNHDPFRDTRW